jgi:hypothetical protein
LGNLRARGEHNQTCFSNPERVDLDPDDLPPFSVNGEKKRTCRI